MTRSKKIYRILKSELQKVNHWKNKPRGVNIATLPDSTTLTNVNVNDVKYVKDEYSQTF